MLCLEVTVNAWQRRPRDVSGRRVEGTRRAGRFAEPAVTVASAPPAPDVGTIVRDALEKVDLPQVMLTWLVLLYVAALLQHCPR